MCTEQVAGLVQARCSTAKSPIIICLFQHLLGIGKRTFGQKITIFWITVSSWLVICYRSLGRFRCFYVYGRRRRRRSSHYFWPTSFPSTTLKTEASSSSERSVTLYQSTRCHIPENSKLHTECCENHKHHFQIRYHTPPPKFSSHSYLATIPDRLATHLTLYNINTRNTVIK